MYGERALEDGPRSSESLGGWGRDARACLDMTFKCTRSPITSPLPPPRPPPPPQKKKRKKKVGPDRARRKRENDYLLISLFGIGYWQSRVVGFDVTGGSILP